ncbi:MAG TPA: 3'-5' exonuclease [Candidatus Paceibacterota bacterium]|nr:3'-5' exonuclease [Candidatus Paceibacterota bacterium]
MTQPKKVIFFDTETTGNTEKDILCQLAYKTGKDSFSALYNPGCRIPPEASAVHHISNKMVEGKPRFKDAEEYGTIKALFEDENSVLVAHNTLFDLAMMRKEDIFPKNFICTLRVARHLDAEGKIDKYNLQYLRYFLEIEIEASAHDALGDVMVLEQLFARLLKKITEEENLSEDEAINKMIEISSHPSIFKKLNFGKYKGMKIEEVLRIDRGWLEWLLSEKEKCDAGGIDEDWIYTLRHYLQK